MKNLLLTLLFTCVLMFSGVVLADKAVTLVWDARTAEADLAGFRIYEKTLGGYNLIADITDITTLTHTFTSIGTDAEIDVKNWVLRAYDTSNNESGDSNVAGYPPAKRTLTIIIL